MLFLTKYYLGSIHVHGRENRVFYIKVLDLALSAFHHISVKAFYSD